MLKNITKNLAVLHVEVEQVRDYMGQTVKMHGIVYKIREMSGFAFVILKTKRTLLQCVYSQDFSSFELSTLKENMSVVITGEVVSDERSRTGIEVRLVAFESLSVAAEETPVVITKGGCDFS